MSGLLKWLTEVLTLLTVVLALFLAGCSKSSFNDDNVAEKTSLRKTTKQLNFIGHWLNEGKREQLVLDLVREYEFLNQDVLINLKFPEELYFDRSIQYSQEKFISNIVAKSNPEWDIVRIEYPPVAAYMNNPQWTKDHLVDFSKIPAYRRTTIPYLLTDEYKDTYWGGMLPGPFIEGQYWALWFNVKIAEKVGIQVKNKGMSVADFINYCRAVNVYNKNNPGNYIIPFHDCDDWETTWNLALQIFASQFTSMDEFNNDFSEVRLERWYNTLKALEEMSQFEVFKHNDGYQAWGESHKRVLEGEALFYVNGSWMYNIWEGMDSDKVWDCAPAELPTYKGSTNLYPLGYACAWGVLKNAPNKQEAIDFLLFMNSESTAKAWVEAAKSPTGIKASGISTSFGADQFDDFTQHINTNYATSAYTARAERYDVLGELNLKNNPYHREVMKGEMTAVEAMEKIRKEFIYEAIGIVEQE